MSKQKLKEMFNKLSPKAQKQALELTAARLAKRKELDSSKATPTPKS